ncbi:MAG: response regulator [Cyanobacteria bacterium J06626_14]
MDDHARFFIDSLANALVVQRSRPNSMLQIVLLEDDPIDCELIETTLKNGGIEGRFICIDNRRDFIDSVSQEPPALILADYVVPTFDGMEALEFTRQACPEVPFILVSGMSGEEQAIEAIKKGATDYVLKQRMERLVPAVQRALREYQERQERQKIAKALLRTDNLLQAIVDASPVGIITLNREQRIMTWNPAAEQIYGWSSERVVERFLPFVPQREQAAFDRYFTQALQNQKALNQECQHRQQNGDLIDINLSLAPLYDADGYVYGAVMTAVDITVRKQIETQRLSLLKQETSARAAAESANRIKDEFLAVLSHELRTPLNSIVGWIKLIKKGNLKPSVLQKALDTIERNAVVQARLIEDLLDLSRIIRGQVRLTVVPVAMAALIRTTVDTLRPAIEAKSIRISLELATDIDRILADPNRFQQILWNLLSNAIKFTPASGSVTVKLELIDTCLQLQVIDSGIGMTADFLPHVFEFFRQADGSATRSQGGLGLGLAITRRLIELHGGTIEVDSPGLDQGTTFTVRLPMQTDQTKAQIDQTSCPNHPDLLNVKALIVDDETDSRELLMIVLEQQGAEVESAESTQTALNLLERFQPDVIISDIGMPRRDGYDFLRTVRSLPDQRLCNVPAIALTAYAREEDRQQAIAAGYQKHVAKPFDIAEIVSIVHQLVRPS